MYLIAAYQIFSSTWTSVDTIEAKKDRTHLNIYVLPLIFLDLMATQQKAMALDLVHTFNVGRVSFKRSTNLNTKEIYLRMDNLFR